MRTILLYHSRTGFAIHIEVIACPPLADADMTDGHLILAPGQAIRQAPAGRLDGDVAIAPDAGRVAPVVTNGDARSSRHAAEEGQELPAIAAGID